MNLDNTKTTIQIVWWIIVRSSFSNHYIKVNYPATSMYLFKVKHGRNRRMCEIFSKRTIHKQTPESLLLTLNMFRILLGCFQSWLWTSYCWRLGNYLTLQIQNLLTNCSSNFPAWQYGWISIKSVSLSKVTPIWYSKEHNYCHTFFSQPQTNWCQSLLPECCSRATKLHMGTLCT